MFDQETASASIEPSNSTEQTASTPFANLLRTKLYIPPKRPHLVVRPRLTERLNDGLSRKLTLISAPPGFGKTTAISDWIAQSRCAVTWVSLDDGDNDPVRFWSYLIAALQRLNPTMGLHSMALLRSLQPIQIESILTFLVNEIDAFADTFALVLEDYHLINVPAIHQGLTFLLDHLPPQMHLYMTSRSDPHLPLAQLRVRDELVELRVADLRFRADEAATFLNQTMELNLIAEHIAVLEMRTEGWVAGLQLAALSMRGRDDLPAFIKAFAGSNRFILDYLAEQVLARQSQDIQAFLLQTSILDRMSASLCNALTGSDNSQNILEQLEQRNLFIVPLDEVRQWYRYHPLFADVLRAHLRQLDSGALFGLHQRASAWFAQHDLLSEAIEHALAGQDYEQMAQLLEQIGRKLFNNAVIFPSIEQWLSKLPDSYLHIRPRLMILQAWLLLRRDELDTAEHCIDIAEQALEQVSLANDIKPLRGEIAALRARLTLNKGTPEQIINYAWEALASLDTDNDGTRSQVMITLGRGYLRQGNYMRAREAFADAMNLGRSARYSYITLYATYFYAYLQRAMGALESSIATCNEALRWAAEFGANTYFEAGIIFVCLADLLRERNDLTHALEFAIEGIKRCAQLGDVGFALLSKFVLVRTHQAMGEIDQTVTEVQEAERFAQQYQINWGIRILGAYKAQLRVIQSRYVAINAIDWMPIEFATIDSQRSARNPFLLVYGYEHNQIALMQLMIVQGRATTDAPLLQKSLNMLDELRQGADASGLLWLRIKTRLLMALAHHAVGDLMSALDQLERALLLAQPERYIRVFLDDGEPMRDLMQLIATSSTVSDYVDMLLSAFGNEPSLRKDYTITRPPLSSHVPSLVEQLSEREFEVLHLIAAGDSNQEIADRLVISIATVKRHISNIYGKLAVTSRTHALVRAKELHLL